MLVVSAFPLPNTPIFKENIMQIATLGFSIIGAVTGTASLLIMAKTAKELQAAKKQIDGEITTIKTKVSRNAQVVKTALGQLDI